MCNSTLCNNGCGLDKCLNGGVFNSKTCSCECPSPYYGKICENQCSSNFTCLNDGIFNRTKCACDCLPQFNGSLCENAITSFPIQKTCLHSSIL